MSLTQEDLVSIQQIVQTTIQTTVRPMVDELASDTAAGFAEVHNRIDRVETRLGRVETRLSNVEGELVTLNGSVNRIENIQRAEVQRVDEHVKVVTLIGKKLNIA